jgi:hypothetical protein
MALIKLASFSADLAIRILHSLIPYAVDFKEIPTANVMAAKSGLIDTAINYLRSSILIIISELRKSINSQTLSLIDKLSIDDPKMLLELAIKDFSNPHNYESLFGGKPWENYSKFALKLYLLIDKFNKIKSSNEFNKLNDIVNDIVITMNVMDGISHNSGSMLNKISDLESEMYGDGDNFNR